MNAWKRPLFAAAGFLAVVFALALVSAPPALTQGRPGTRIQALTLPPGTPIIPQTVLTLDDVYETPYSRDTSASLGDTQARQDLSFDIPAGKRLVIETVTAHFIVQPGQKARAFLDTMVSGGFFTSDTLTMESQGVVDGMEQLFGTHPIKERVDGTSATNDIVFIFERSPAVGEAFVGASVHGYLVPSIPPVP